MKSNSLKATPDTSQDAIIIIRAKEDIAEADKVKIRVVPSYCRSFIQSIPMRNYVCDENKEADCESQTQFIKTH